MSERGQRERVRKFSTKYRGRSRSVGRRMMEQAEDEDQKPSKQWQKANASEYFAEFGRDLWVEQKLSDLSDKEFDFLYRVGPEDVYIDDPEGPPPANYCSGLFQAGGISKAYFHMKALAAAQKAQSTSQQQGNDDGEKQENDDSEQQGNDDGDGQKNGKNDVKEVMIAPLSDDENTEEI